MRMTNQTVLTVAYLLFSVSALAADDPFKITPDVVYGHKAGMALTYDVIQNQQACNGAAVLFMASGGWFSGWEPPEAFVSNEARGSIRHLRQLVEKGYTVAIVRHGSAPYFKVPDAVNDVRRALRHFKHNAADFNVDPNRIGVTGGSAGGHLSLILGTTSDDERDDAKEEFGENSNAVAAVVAYFPPVDLRNAVGPSRRLPALDFDKDRAADVSPLLHVTRDDAPTLLIHGDRDELVELSQSQRIHEAFQSNDVTSKLIVMENAGHGFRGEDGRLASAALIQWFDEHLASAGSQRWEGTWKSAATNGHGGELKCVATQIAGHRWEATFSGFCNKQFVYEVTMTGRKAGDKVLFSGEADLGDKDGGIYQWSGELAGGNFTGKYESATGKAGAFEMKRPESPAQEVAGE